MGNGTLSRSRRVSSFSSLVNLSSSRNVANRSEGIAEEDDDVGDVVNGLISPKIKKCNTILLIHSTHDTGLAKSLFEVLRFRSLNVEYESGESYPPPLFYDAAIILVSKALLSNLDPIINEIVRVLEHDVLVFPIGMYGIETECMKTYPTLYMLLSAFRWTMQRTISNEHLSEAENIIETSIETFQRFSNALVDYFNKTEYKIDRLFSDRSVLTSSVTINTSFVKLLKFKQTTEEAGVASTMKKAYICYAKADTSFVEKLVNALSTEVPKIDVWFDQLELRSDSQWQREVTSAIVKCSCLLFINSPNSAHSTFCKNDIDLAIVYNKPLYVVAYRPTVWDDSGGCSIIPPALVMALSSCIYSLSFLDVPDSLHKIKTWQCTTMIEKVKTLKQEMKKKMLQQDFESIYLGKPLDKRKTIIGIDFGTSKCSVGVYRSGKVDILPIGQDGEKSLRSVVSFLSDFTVSCGDYAFNKMLGSAEDTKTVFPYPKCLLGYRYGDAFIQRHFKNLPLALSLSCGAPLARVLLNIQCDNMTKQVSPEEATALLLRALTDAVELQLGEPIGGAIVSVPSIFGAAQTTCLLRACQISKIPVVQLLHEPQASVLAYTHDQLKKLEGKTRKMLVIDWGAGNLDIALIQVTVDDGVLTCTELATGGHNHIGGENIDWELVDSYRDTLFIETQKDLTENPHLLFRLKDLLNQCKYDLKENEAVEISAEIDDDKVIDFELSRDDINDASLYFFEFLLNAIEHVLQECGVAIEDVADVILSGGSTNIPEIRSLLDKMFTNILILDSSVVVGAAIHAHYVREQSSNNTFSLYNHVDIISHSIGIEVTKSDGEDDKASPLDDLELQNGYRYISGAKAIFVTNCRRNTLPHVSAHRFRCPGGTTYGTAIVRVIQIMHSYPDITTNKKWNTAEGTLLLAEFLISEASVAGNSILVACITINSNSHPMICIYSEDGTSILASPITGQIVGGIEKNSRQRMLPTYIDVYSGPELAEHL